MGLVFAILLMGVPLAAAVYDLLKTGDGVGNFKLGELIAMAAPSGSPAKSAIPAPAAAPVKPAPTPVKEEPAPVKEEAPVVSSASEPPPI